MERVDKPRHVPTANELQRRRRNIDRGLRRSHYAVVAAAVMVGLFALAALWLSGEAGHRAEEARLAQQHAETNAADARSASVRLWEFSSHAARLQRLTRAPGQRVQTLEIIGEAARFRPSRELRDEALSALLLPDAGTNLVWHKEVGFEIAATYDTNFEHFILNNNRQRAIVRRASDGKSLMDEEGLGPGTAFWQFSRDGRLATIAFNGGQLGVWDWREKKLVAKYSTIDARFAEPPFDFSPDGRQLWLLASPECLQERSTATGQPGMSIAPAHPARSLRLSPSGKFAALACGNILEVWELSSRTRHSTLVLTDDIWSMAWQPGEERLGIGCRAGLFLWDIGAADAATLRKDGAMTVLFFNADGDLLFATGWDVPGEAWSVRNRLVVFRVSASSLLGLSQDQTRLSVAQNRVGYGLQEYLPPKGVRDWPPPPSLGASTQSADVDPRERWVLTTYQGGWLVCDAASGRELARARCGGVQSAIFTADGSNVLAWAQNGLRHWPLGLHHEEGTLTVGASEVLWDWGGKAPELAVFAAGRRHAACCQDGVVSVLDVENPRNPIQFPLQRPGDNSHFLSPDGRWLLTGHHNQHGIDWYDTRFKMSEVVSATYPWCWM